MAKASELCQKKGGTNIKVLLSRNSDPVSGMLFCSIAASGHGPSAMLEQVTGLYYLQQMVRLLLTADKKESQVLTS
jgi:hypothetical protein